MGTVWDSIRESNRLQDVFSVQLCPPKESTLFPGTFNGQGGYMVKPNLIALWNKACVACGCRFLVSNHVLFTRMEPYGNLHDPPCMYLYTDTGWNQQLSVQYREGDVLH